MHDDIQRIDDLMAVKIHPLLKESKEEGFRFIERLLRDYQDGTNTFQQDGEVLFGVFRESGEIIAIGGLNQDPYAEAEAIGRLRRFYVRKEYRRYGIGKRLVERLIKEAANHYHTLVLHTDTEQGSAFYSSLGFTEGQRYPKTTHFMDLPNKR